MIQELSKDQKNVHFTAGQHGIHGIDSITNELLVPHLKGGQSHKRAINGHQSTQMKLSWSREAGLLTAPIFFLTMTYIGLANNSFWPRQNSQKDRSKPDILITTH
jgi:hypothetical protein